ncbi:Scarecrow-like protein 8 [Musa troglodytarum]|uniref:Scarecrow-like protein 8 n=1 Tax=Musa troglodytarum TaxID=320322 RepID=A0A9E7FX45_9LILI|nr:Scarecrow-like protein 8 [Musa troglodytarum]
MASGFSGRCGVQSPIRTRSEAGTGAILKRSFTERERLQQQEQMQLENALFLRSVKQRTLLASSASSHLPPPPPVDLSSGSSSLTSSNLSASGFARRQEMFFATQTAVGLGSDNRPSSAMQERLQELERQLLDEDDEEDAVSASGSAVTTAEWSDAMQQLTSPPLLPPPAAAVAAPNQLCPSPTNSSSTVSSSASSSPPSLSTAAAASSRQMLLDTAVAIGDGNIEAAAGNLAVLKRAANHRGDAEQRLTAVMLAALVSCMNPPPTGNSCPSIAELCSAEHFAATQVLYELSPCFKLGLIAANLAILEATKDHPKIHILDFQVGQGGQYVTFLHALAERQRLRPTARPPLIRITAVADPSSPFTSNTGGNVMAVGHQIEKLAERAGLAVRFGVVHWRAADLDAAALGCEPGEALAVNLAFALARVPDESVSPSNPRDELLRRVRALRPRVVAMVEQDINTSTAAFAARFGEACAHYGALLDSLDATVGRDSPERARVEAWLARRAVNSVATEGANRVERCEVFGKWRARMGMAGFEPLPFGPAMIEPVKAKLASVRSNPGFTIKEEGGRLGFGWKDRVLTVASSWR